MGQQPKELAPHESGRHFLGAELRTWRERRGLSAAQLAALVFTSSDLVLKVERAQRRATSDLIRPCDEQLNTGGALGRLLAFIEHSERLDDVKRGLVPQGAPTEIVLRVIAETLRDDEPRQQSPWPANGAIAKVYQFRRRDGRD
ncbi:helix-turn-helix domain-containing protein [Dactylosporangium sp. CA-139066]|uniref:helix-turn-helix domain-containing protein n=1 Tax=Dactylosporangium sp. CA-139066 TaxID=3239930 RepID=UPI003D8FBB75